MRAWLSGLPVLPDTSVVVLRPFDKQGARMTFGSFVEHYDDLWYPAADDVLVYWEHGDELSFVVLEHEEAFTAAPDLSSRPSRLTVERAMTAPPDVL